MAANIQRPIPWIEPGDPFPPAGTAWGADDPAPGLLAAGGRLDVTTLLNAYAQGIFPWFSLGQPILWWSTDPRMVLRPEGFRLHRSLAKTLKKFAGDPRCELRFDTAFPQVIRACAHVPRGAGSIRTEGGPAEAKAPGDTQHHTADTWIVPDMVAAYEELNKAGFAHSVETWIDGQMVGGLYCVAIGRAVFGESMFSKRSNASKMALAGLVAFCLAHGIAMIDCQQNTRHLASLGAAEISREQFIQHVSRASQQPPPPWQFETVYWNRLLFWSVLTISGR